MRRPTPSRAADLLLAGVAALAILALLPLDPLATGALAVLTVTLIAWPAGVLLWLARRWARVGDGRFVLLAGLLVAAAVGSTLVAIALTG